MSLKGRLRRLDARVRWLETEGMYRHIEAGLRIVEMLQKFADSHAADPAAAARWRQDFPNFPIKLPPPSAPAPPHPEEPCIAPRLEGGERALSIAEAPPVEPTLQGVSSASARKHPDAAVPAAPQGEDVVAPPQAGELPPPEPPDMAIRPVFWPPRGAYDDDEPPGTNGRCLTEYDPLAGEYDDDD